LATRNCRLLINAFGWALAFRSAAGVFLTSLPTMVDQSICG
jgi:hypothetical protein